MLAYKLEDIQASANVGATEKCVAVKKQIVEIRKLIEARDERVFHRICVMIYRYPECHMDTTCSDCYMKGREESQRRFGNTVPRSRLRQTL